MWKSSLSPTTCKECRERHGNFYDKNKPMVEPPLHPNCSCVLIPVDSLSAKKHEEEERVSFSKRKGKTPKKSFEYAGRESLQDFLQSYATRLAVTTPAVTAAPKKGKEAETIPGRSKKAVLAEPPPLSEAQKLLNALIANKNAYNAKVAKEVAELKASTLAPTPEEINEIVLDIPQDERKLGTTISRMAWTDINQNSCQIKLRDDAAANGRYKISKPEYYGLIGDRISIAVKPNIGNQMQTEFGDYLDVVFLKTDGTEVIYKCIVGEWKGDDAVSPWGHDGGKGVIEIIYHAQNPPLGYNRNPNAHGGFGGGPDNDGNNPWGKGRVVKITKKGNYYD